MTLPSRIGAAGLLLLAAAALVTLNPFRWIVFGDALHYRLGTTALGLLLLVVACVVTMVKTADWRRWTALPLAVCSTLAALWCAYNALGYLIFANPDKLQPVAVSPDGRLKVVLHDNSGWAGYDQGLYVQSTDGFFSKRAYLGCRNLYEGETKFDRVRFTAPDTVVVKAGEEEWTLRFDPKDVKTINTTSENFCKQDLYTG
ncbi:hypothetical protein [Actinomadura rugatobispora]|uniref:Uncharacterized protein n=1 Tax=Actinomadura rugatobispora TaxID=1994 RepID=A0ABW0ZXZ6_9ACTN|nr:hypothetical protein GCM10010200_040490 [Actinomadura rugatobispora]